MWTSFIGQFITPTEENWDNYSRYRNNYQRACREKKRLHYQSELEKAGKNGRQNLTPEIPNTSKDFRDYLPPPPQPATVAQHVAHPLVVRKVIGSNLGPKPRHN